MTQNTQTTLERIAEMILRSIEQSIFNFDTGYDADPIAKEIAAEIDALTAERDAARAQVIEARAMASEREDFRLKQIADIRQERDAYREGYNRLTAQLAEARAEVERLRLPAEAWRTLEAYREAERNGTSEEAEGARRVHIPIRDAARARAAKESL